MSLASILRNGVATIKSVTSSIQDEVRLQRWLSETQTGAATYGAEETYSCIIILGAQDRPGPAGQINRAYAEVLFLEELEPTGQPERQEPLDSRDLITLPDGTTGPIVEISGPIDGETGRPFIMQVWLGALSRSASS